MIERGILNMGMIVSFIIYSRYDENGGGERGSIKGLHVLSFDLNALPLLNVFVCTRKYGILPVALSKRLDCFMKAGL